MSALLADENKFFDRYLMNVVMIRSISYSYKENHKISFCEPVAAAFVEV